MKTQMVSSRLLAVCLILSTFSTSGVDFLGRTDESISVWCFMQKQSEFINSFFIKISQSINIFIVLKCNAVMSSDVEC